ncbi:MAG: hypothetical protein JRN21_04300 [Nitrososphaerota archaeon]|nr:hypothetical protein [Nitrososphaerota archaeon]
MEQTPRFVGVSMLERGRPLFHAVVKGTNGPGVLGDLATKMGGAGFNILLVNECSPPESRESTATFFVEGEAGTTEDELRSAIAGSPYALEVVVRKSESKLLVDSFPFPLMYFPSGRGVIFPQSGVRAMFQDIIKMFGTGGESILFRAGHAVGRQGTEDVARVMGEEALTKDPDLFTGLYAALGWGRMEIVEAAPDLSAFSMKLEEGFECTGVKSPVPVCHFTRGLIAGSAERALSRATACEEKSCAAAGDPYCLFTVTAKGKLASRSGSSWS